MASVEAIGRVRSKSLSCIEAADFLGVSKRHFRRLRPGYEEEGAEVIADKRRGRPSFYTDRALINCLGQTAAWLEENPPFSDKSNLPEKSDNPS